MKAFNEQSLPINNHVYMYVYMLAVSSTDYIFV